MDLIVDEKCRVLYVTLNRPEKRNALTGRMCAGMVKAIQAAQKRRDIAVILLTAAGQVFCAGMDLDEASEMHEDELADVHEDLFTIGANSSKPIVVCVNGAALGGGLGLVAQGHIVLAGHGAVFGLPEIRVGLWPFLVYRAVEAAMGARRTLELSLTGRVFHAPDALQWGMVHHVCPPAEVADRANALARELAKASPTALAAGMQYFYHSRERSSKEAGELARKLRAELMQSADFKEGYEAFKHKREPHWPSLSQDLSGERGKRRPPESKGEANARD
jgi:enoyl-CoA hydratase/carnithine racemase